MKLSNAALAEIVDIFREGILEGKDMSSRLREIDLVVQEGAILSKTDQIGTLTLSEEYLKANPRAGDWDKN